MSFTRWLRKLRSALTTVPRRRKRRRAAHWSRAFRPQLEALEDRCLLSLSAPVNYGAGVDPQAVLTADFNSDTRLDIAVVNNGGNSVSVLLGNGTGTFQTRLNSATGAGPVSMAVGYLNGDSFLDLVTANAGNVSVLLGKGDGTFQAPTNINIGSDPASVAVGDFNGDGKLDIGVTSNLYVYDGFWYGPYFHYEGSANVLLGNGLGSFSAPNTTALGWGTFIGAAAADFNGDGKDDFATVISDGGTVSVLLGASTGVLGAPTSINTGWYPRAVTVGEFTGDDILDLATAGQTVDILPGIGDGTFQGVVRQYVDPVALAAADFNGDTNLDLVSVEPSTGVVTVLLGLGTGAVALPLDFKAGVSPTGVAVGDFNGDTRPDAAVVNAGSNNVSVLLNDGAWPALDAPTISIADVTVTEGNDGTVNAAFKVTLSAAYSQTVSVKFATADGAATVAGGDYVARIRTVTFVPGDMIETVNVVVNGDRLAEYGEWFYARLSSPTNAFIADGTAYGTIADDEPIASIDYGPIYVTEGDSGASNAMFTVRLAAAYDAPVSVNFSTYEGDTDFLYAYWGYYGYYQAPAHAASNSDFQSLTDTITFAAGETEKTIPVVVNGDQLGEVDEYFSVNLTSGNGARIGANHAVGIIGNDEPYVSISNPASKVEGNTGTTTLTFTVTLSAPSDGGVTVTYATADGSATVEDGDYQAKTKTLTFAEGETSQTFDVLVNGDRRFEYDEYFNVNLTGATGAIISYPWGYASIKDDEPRISITSPSLKEGHSGTKVLKFTVTLAAVYDETVTVQYATYNDSATAGEDYVATSGTLTFAPGQTSKTISVTIKGDKKKEANEYFYVLLSDASSNSQIEYEYGWGGILNDDGRI